MFETFQLNQTTERKNENKNCLNELNELNFFEVLQNYFSNYPSRKNLHVQSHVLNFYPPKFCFRILISYLEF